MPTVRLLSRRAGVAGIGVIALMAAASPPSIVGMPSRASLAGLR